MPRKVKTQKKKPQKRKSPEYAGIESMNRAMQATTQMVGNVAIASMGIGLASAVIGGIK